MAVARTTIYARPVASLLSACLVALAAAAGAGAAPQGQAVLQTQSQPGGEKDEAPYHAWFKVTAATRDHWRLVAAPGNPLELRVLPKEASSGARPKKIMVVYPRPSSAYDVAISKMLSVFANKLLAVELTVINFQNEDERGRQILNRVEDEQFDLILAMGSESTAWLWEHYRGGRLPVVTVCSKDPVLLGQAAAYDRGSGSNFAFTSLNVPIDVQMAYVAALKPQLKSIAVIADGANVSAMETQARPVLEYAKARGVSALELTVRDPANAKAELAQLIKGAVERMKVADPSLASSIFWVTGSTAVFREIATINAHADRAAVLSVVPDIVRGGGDSAMLSIGISFESNAQLAALYASDVLTGRSAVGQIKVGVVTPPDMSINFQKVRVAGASIPLSIFAAAGTIYDYEGNLVRVDGKASARLSQ